MTKLLSALTKMLAKLGKVMFHRMVIVAAMILMQLAFYVVMFAVFRNSQYYRMFSWALMVLSVLVVLWIVGNRSNPGYKIGWIIIVLVFLPFGAIAYLPPSSR